MATTQIRLLHPDHEQRDDDGVYVTDDPVEAMNLQTRGYRRLADGEKAPKAPTRSNTGSSSSTSKSGSESGS